MPAIAPKIGRLFCPRADCGSGFAEWMVCPHGRTCPPESELLDRTAPAPAEADQ